MTVESMWDGPNPPRANLNRQAKTVVHMWDARELLKPYLSKLLMLRICGVAQSCSSCEASGSVIRSKPDAPSSDYRAHVGWTPKMLRSSLKRPAKAVADMWDGPELLQPNLSKLLVLRTSGMAQSYSILARRSYMCSRSRAEVQSVESTHAAHMPDAPIENCRRRVGSSRNVRVQPVEAIRAAQPEFLRLGLSKLLCSRTRAARVLCRSYSCCAHV